jgi:integrase
VRRKSWKTACDKAGVHRLFHDLRRSAARNLIRAGVPEKTCMAITGHRTRSMFDRYCITSEKDLASPMRKVDRYLNCEGKRHAH